MRLERLKCQAQLAQPRYEEVDPLNRLVAATLERRWNQALQEKGTAQEELSRQRQASPCGRLLLDRDPLRQCCASPPAQRETLRAQSDYRLSKASSV